MGMEKKRGINPLSFLCCCFLLLVVLPEPILLAPFCSDLLQLLTELAATGVILE
jgi:hypothetical protein